MNEWMRPSEPSDRNNTRRFSACKSYASAAGGDRSTGSQQALRRGELLGRHVHFVILHCLQVYVLQTTACTESVVARVT